MYPYVSVIMPVHNEEDFIQRSLGAVLAQDYPPDRMEVLIVDGLSSDRTYDNIRKLNAKPCRMEVRLLENKGRIVPTGLNLAIRQAKGDVIIRVDGHTVIAPDYVRQCVQALRRTEADNVGGRMDGIGHTMFGETVALATSSPFGVGGARFHYSDKEEWTDTTYLGAWHRSVFERIGLFDEELVRNQDDEFNYRLRAAGGKILLSPRITSQYTVRSTPWSLLKQYFQYGFWKVRVLQKHPFQMRPRQFVPPAFVLALLASLVFFHLARNWWPLMSIGSMYLLANLAASVHTSARHGWRYLLLLPLTFATLHVSYGSGFLLGLVRFIGRWNDTNTRPPVLSYDLHERSLPPAD
jgi:glycosyltransferase involved in cell wall biosynthesis